MHSEARQVITWAPNWDLRVRKGTRRNEKRDQLSRWEGGAATGVGRDLGSSVARVVSHGCVPVYSLQPGRTRAWWEGTASTEPLECLANDPVLHGHTAPHDLTVSLSAGVQKAPMDVTRSEGECAFARSVDVRKNI